MINDDFWDYFKEKKIDVEKVRGLLKESNRIVEYERKILKTGKYWQISKDEVRCLYAVVRLKEPLIVIETGMGSGVSTTAILSALRGRGKLISIDPGIPYGRGDKRVGFLIPEELRKNLEYVKGTSSEKFNLILPSLKHVDVFFHDSDHSYDNVMFELKSMWSKMRGDPTMLIDNYDWSDAPNDFAKEKGLKLRNLADDLAMLSK